MRKLFFAMTLILGALGSLPVEALAEDFRMVELVAPRQVAEGEAIEIQITTSTLPKGSVLIVSSERGQVLGSVSPFGQGFARGPITATVPLPRSALVAGHVRLRLQVREPGKPPRPPQEGEIQRIELVLAPNSE
jgi:hypothetical protein